MYVHGWSWLGLSLLISAIGFYSALRTSLGNRDGDEVGFGGCGLGIGGLLIAIRLLLLFTGYTHN
jgi:hypothetical protein